MVSVDAEPGTKPDMSVAGCTPIMANRLTVACCIALIRAYLISLMVVIESP